MPPSYDSYSSIVSEVGDLQMKTMKVHEVHHLGKVLRVGCVGGSDQDPGTDSWSVGLPHSVPQGPQIMGVKEASRMGSAVPWRTGFPSKRVAGTQL